MDFLCGPKLFYYHDFEYNGKYLANPEFHQLVCLMSCVWHHLHKSLTGMKQEQGI